MLVSSLRHFSYEIRGLGRMVGWWGKLIFCDCLVEKKLEAFVLHSLPEAEMKRMS